MKRQGWTLMELLIPPKMTCPRRKALTLIELLIVVGIIVTLMGLILSVTLLARRMAYIAHCTNNLKQIYLALKLYEEDYGAAPYLPHNLVYYKPDIASVLICPADPTEGTRFLGGMPRNWGFRCSYEILYLEFLIPVLLHGEFEYLDGTWRERHDPNNVMAFCRWHRPVSSTKPDLAVFYDGSVRWWSSLSKRRGQKPEGKR